MNVKLKKVGLDKMIAACYQITNPLINCRFLVVGLKNQQWLPYLKL